MLTPQQNTALTYLRDALPSSTPQQRAKLLEQISLAVYDYVKFHAPEGEGLDGRDGPERRSLGLVVDRAREYADMFTRGLTTEGSR